ncbi:MAG TPA: GNAT family protein [Longimicrobium sp.]|jgi:RimJ/RimL family protein N-acetyltransferase|nr:GNAT family protein [Longimicrobium sp.]
MSASAAGDAGAVELRTARLRLRPMGEVDLPGFVAYRRDPEVARYQGWDETFSAEDARALFEKLRGVVPGTPGVWFRFAIEEAAEGTLLGDCVLRVGEDDPRQAEIGFTLAAGYQGRGYATEAVRALLGYAFTTLDLHRVVAVTDARNAAAARLLQRIGMRREAHFIQNVWYKGAWGDEFSFAMLREEWLAREESR